MSKTTSGSSPVRSASPDHPKVHSSRRAFLRRAGSLGAAVVAFPAAAGAAGHGDGNTAKRPFEGRDGSAILSKGAVAGPIGHIDREELRATIGVAPDPTVDVVFSADSVLWRDEFATLDDFVVGDRVIVEGRMTQQGPFEGQVMQPFYQAVQISTRAARGQVLDTSIGPMEFSSRTTDEGTGERADIERFTNRQVVLARVRYDPMTSHLMVVAVELRHAA